MRSNGAGVNKVIAGQAQAAARQTADPGAAPVIRFQVPGSTTAVGTAVARLISRKPYTWKDPISVGVPTVAKSDLGDTPLLDDNSDYPLVLLRDPVVRHITRELVWTDPGASNPISRYDVSVALQPGWHRDSDSGNPVFGLLEVTSVPISLPFSWLTHNSGPQAYGPICPTGSVAGSRVVWIDACANYEGALILGLGPDWGTSAELHVNATLWRHDSEDTKSVVQTYNYGVPAYGVLYNYFWVLNSGYHSLTVEAAPELSRDLRPSEHIGMINIELNIRTSCTYRHHLTPDYQTHLGVIDQVRVLGASVLLQNNNPTMVKGGTVIAAQLNDSDWTKAFIDKQYLTDVNAQSAETLNFDRGLYAFFKPCATPNGANPMTMRRAFEHVRFSANIHSIQTAAGSLPLFYPFQQEAVLVVRVTPPPSTELFSGGASLNLIVATLIEFTTNDQFYDLEQSDMSSTAASVYFEELRRFKQFHENPNHLKNLRAYLAKAASAIVKYGPTALDYAATAARLLA